MTLDLKAMILVVIYAVLSNMILISVSDSFDGISCPDFSLNEYTTSYNTSLNYTSDSLTQDNGASFFKLLLNRCNGLPYWVFWLTQVPTILGILYVLRAFIGFT